MRRWVGPVVALSAIAASGVSGQEDQPGPRGFFSVALITATPQGDFASQIEQGYGIQAGAKYHPDPDGIVSLWADFGFLNYGRERFSVCSTISCRLTLDLYTTNNIFFAGGGPEVRLSSGAFQPYVKAGLGLGYFWTQTSLSGSDSHDDFARTENFRDAFLQWRAGGGLRTRVKGGRAPVYLDFGAEYHGNGIVEYLREGDILDHPDGSIAIFPNRSEANLVTFRLGVSIGISRRRRGYP